MKTRDEIHALLKRGNPYMDDANFALWLDSCMAEQATKEAAKPTLKRYSIRRYYTYVDEFFVEAASLQEADEKVDVALDSFGTLVEKTASGVEQVLDNEYVDYDSTQGNEVDEHGNWVTEPEEL